ncbi:LacI family DNA-binding transcriptional regulator [Paractinoplanes rishiriensis]|uniref:LacI family transcriptional regulator n=1 Tax=Paractinoplanes rishiriensis TaxID=1050105 RepID=A0A919N132_9ACTN|nr:LacI family DNA-binding transcriptional regulator [Actinoplanes rishiriensis]GIF00446.1 LacI family transcriptional regulator [Actinoplanes rishiriensis]
MTRPPGSTDVAKLAGVSQKTVSRVFNGERYVTAEVRERVLDAAARLGYRPNRAARALKLERHHRIGVVSLGSALFGPSTLLVALERAARETGYALSIVHTLEGARGSVAEAVQRLLAEGVDAIVLSEPIDEGEAPLRVDVPVLTIGRAPSVTAPAVLTVLEEEGGDLIAPAVRHLLALGHHTVHHVAGPQRWWAAQQRLRSWRQALEAAGRPVPEPVEGDWTPESGYRIGTRLGDDVTAVLAANDDMAIGVIRALADAGRRVPEDVSVVGFDDIPVAAYVSPPLTTVRTDNALLAGVGLQRLIDHLKDPQATPRPFPSPMFELIARGSSGPPRR